MNQKSKHTIEIEVTWGDGFFSHNVKFPGGTAAITGDYLRDWYGIERPYEVKVGDVVKVANLSTPSTYTDRIGVVNHASYDSDWVEVDLGDRTTTFYKKSLEKIGKLTK